MTSDLSIKQAAMAVFDPAPKIASFKVVEFRAVPGFGEGGQIHVLAAAKGGVQRLEPRIQSCRSELGLPTPNGF